MDVRLNCSSVAAVVLTQVSRDVTCVFACERMSNVEIDSLFERSLRANYTITEVTDV